MMRSILIVASLFIGISVFGQGKPAPTPQQYKATIDSLRTAVQNDPNNVELHLTLADELYKLNAIYKAQPEAAYKLKQVMEVMDNAIKQNPDMPQLYSARGAYKKLIYSDYDGAVEDLTKAIELNPDNPDWYFNRANYKTVEAACSDWKKCSDLGDYRCVKIYQQLCVNPSNP